MQAGGKLLAWIESRDNHNFIAAFVATHASRRHPATRQCKSRDEARLWVEEEAEALGGVAIEWTDHAPRAARVA
jgi:hypothetical protein